jgi:hypothetical protein
LTWVPSSSIQVTDPVPALKLRDPVVVLASVTNCSKSPAPSGPPRFWPGLPSKQKSPWKPKSNVLTMPPGGWLCMQMWARISLMVPVFAVALIEIACPSVNPVVGLTVTVIGPVVPVRARAP